MFGKIEELKLKYKNKEYLKSQYLDYNKTMQEIADDCNCSRLTIRNWLIRFGIRIKTKSEVKIGKKRQDVSTRNIENNPMWNNEAKIKISKSKMGEKNLNWKGDNVGYGALHIWISKNKLKPEICELCNKSGKLELSCKEHNYTRNIEDYQWVHHKCHIRYDKQKREMRGSEL